MSLSVRLHWVYTTLSSGIIILLVMVNVSSRRHLVEARELLSETLIYSNLADLLIKMNNTDEARKQLHESKILIIQYAVLRNIGHSSLAGSVFVVRETGMLEELQRDRIQKIYDYSVRESLWWEIFDNYIYMQWKDSKEHWTDWE